MKRPLLLLIAATLVVCGLLLWAMKVELRRHDEALLRTAAAAVKPVAVAALSASAPVLEPLPPEAGPPELPLPSLAPLTAPAWDLVLPGDWISDERGDAVKGNHLTDGFRIRFEHAAKDSKTPWHLVFMKPTKTTRTSVDAEGGCGFYLTGTAYCRGYGLDVDGKAFATLITFEWMDPDILRVKLGNVFDETVRKRP